MLTPIDGKYIYVAFISDWFRTVPAVAIPKSRIYTSRKWVRHFSLYRGL